jgi:hypothetical protein
MSWGVRIVCAFFCMLVSNFHSYAAGGLQLGPFCIDTLPVVYDHPNDEPKPAGVWMPFSVNTPAGGKAVRVVIFDAAIPDTAQDLKCGDLLKFAKTKGIQAVISGTVNRIDMTGKIFKPNDGANRIQIEPGKFSANFVTVDEGGLDIGGGRVALSGGGATLDNATLAFGTKGSVSGTFNIGLSGRPITNARLDLPGGAFGKLTLKPTSPEVFQYNLTGKHALIWEGNFTSSAPFAMSGTAITLPNVRLEQPDVKVAQAEVSASHGALTAKISDTKGRANALSATLGKSVLRLAEVNTVLGRMTGKLSQAATSLSGAGLSFFDSTFASENARLISAAGEDIIKGPVRISVKELSTERVDVAAKWPQPTTVGFGGFFGSKGISEANVSLIGPPSTPKLGGDVKVAGIKVGTLALAADSSFAFSSSLATIIHIPIHLSSGPKQQAVTLADKDQVIILKAGLKSFDLKADLELNINDLAKSRIVIAPQAFNLALNAVISTQPFVAGTQPAFGDLEVKAINPTAVALGSTRTGLVELSATTLTLGEPLLRIGQKGGEVKVKVSLKSEGNADLYYDLTTDKTRLVEGTFAAHDVDFKLLEAGKELDLDGTLLRDAEGKIGLLKVAFIKVAGWIPGSDTDASLGTAHIENLALGGTSVRRPHDAAHPGEISYDARIERPFKITEANAAEVKIDKLLDIQILTSKGIDLALTNASADFSGGFGLHDGAISISVDQIAAMKAGGAELYQFSNARIEGDGTLTINSGGISVNGAGIHASVQVAASGQSDKLTGDGHLRIDPFSGAIQTSLSTGFKCNDGNILKIDTELNIALGLVDLNLVYNAGKIDGSALLGLLGLAVHSKSPGGCDGPVMSHVVQKKGKWWTDGVCTQLWPPKAWHCHWESPEISYSYHATSRILGFGGVIGLPATTLRLSGGHLSFCSPGPPDMAQFVIIGPLLVPQIDSSANIVAEIAAKGANILLQVQFGIWETFVATAVANGAGWLALAGGGLACLVS